MPNWKKIADVALTGASIASTFTGIGWIGLAARGGTLFRNALKSGATAKEAGLVAFAELVEYVEALEADPTLTNEQRKARAADKLRELAADGGVTVKERHIELGVLVALMAAKNEISAEEALLLLNVDG